MPVLEPSIAEILGWALVAAAIGYAALIRRGVGPAIATAVLFGAATKVALVHAI